MGEGRKGGEGRGVEGEGYRRKRGEGTEVGWKDVEGRGKVRKGVGRKGSRGNEKRGRAASEDLLTLLKAL